MRQYRQQMLDRLEPDELAVFAAMSANALDYANRNTISERLNMTMREVEAVRCRLADKGLIKQIWRGKWRLDQLMTRSYQPFLTDHEWAVLFEMKSSGQRPVGYAASRRIACQLNLSQQEMRDALAGLVDKCCLRRSHGPAWWINDY